MNLGPESVLEVGHGDGVLGHYLRENVHIEYKSLDIAEDLAPDILGSVEDIPLPDDSFDIVCAFEVLEHMPFEQFARNVSEMKRVARKYVVISVPHFGPMLRLAFKVPFFPYIDLSYKIPFPRKHVFNGQHYWEVGKRGYPTKRVTSELKKFGTLVKHFVPNDAPYHHFFILDIAS